MIKRETYSLLSMIQVYYDQFEVNQMKVDLWHEALKSYELQELKQNLSSYVRDSPYPPKVSDLVPKACRWSLIPNSDETLKMIYPKEKRASKETRLREGAKIQKILGIVREQYGRN
jgi:hypothetical protein